VQALSNHGIALHILASPDQATVDAYMLAEADHIHHILLLHFSSSITEVVAQCFNALIASLTVSQLGW